MSRTPHAPSYYAASANPAPYRQELHGETTADVCIIGAGYTGLSTGLHLAEAGFKVVILEAAQVGWGASGRNGGQIVHSYSRDIDVIESRYGKELAKILGGMAFEGAKIIRERVAKYNIQCDLVDGGVFAAITQKQLGHLEAQKALWEKYGNNHLKLLDATETQKIVNTDRYVGALVDMSGGHFHPLNLALGEAAAFEANGGVIYENSKVTRIDQGPDPVVWTKQHGKVNAKYIVVAGNAYLGNLVPKLASMSMPCGTQVIATEPLGSLADSIIPSNYCVEDCNFLLDYFRLSADKRLIYGGGVIYGARDPDHIESIVRPNMLKTFPQLKDVDIDYAWTGNFLLTLSRLPEVGRIGNNIFYSQGCSGHGITYTHLAGRLLSEVIQGQSSRFDAFEKLPHYPFPGGRLFRVPFTALGAWYYDLRDKLGI